MHTKGDQRIKENRGEKEKASAPSANVSDTILAASFAADFALATEPSLAQSDHPPSEIA